MRHELLVVVGGAAVVIAGASGCSSSDEKSATSSSSSSSSASASASAGAQTKLTIDGADQPLDGAPVCTTVGGKVNIIIGEAGSGVVAILGSGDTPSVTSVALGNVGGVALAVGPGMGEATAKKSGSAYSITGNATGADITKLTSGVVTKPFELVVVCP